MFILSFAHKICIALSSLESGCAEAELPLLTDVVSQHMEHNEGLRPYAALWHEATAAPQPQPAETVVRMLYAHHAATQSLCPDEVRGALGAAHPWYILAHFCSAALLHG
jgi:hypothetical protein